MSSPRRAVLLVVGTFVAVAAVVIGTSATTWRAPDDSTPAANSRHFSLQQPVAQPVAQPVSDSAHVPPPASIGDLPDTSTLLADAGLRARSGEVLARGDRLVLERVPLSSPITIQRDGIATRVDSVYRLTISAGPYVMRDMPAVVSVDGVVLGIGAESTDLSTLTAYTYDAAVLRGSSAAVTYGLPGQVAPVWSTSIEVTR